MTHCTPLTSCAVAYASCTAQVIPDLCLLKRSTWKIDREMRVIAAQNPKLIIHNVWPSRVGFQFRWSTFRTSREVHQTCTSHHSCKIQRSAPRQRGIPPLTSVQQDSSPEHTCQPRSMLHSTVRGDLWCRANEVLHFFKRNWFIRSARVAVKTMEKETTTWVHFKFVTALQTFHVITTAHLNSLVRM